MGLTLQTRDPAIFPLKPGWSIRLGMTRVLPAQERPHEEAHLFRPVGMVRADRAGAARKATPVHAIRAGCTSKVSRAGGDIVARL